ncbi:hypothetical protein CAOG_02634 [Capsaspora owczarzaki ATCC 30864]|uniref:Uncharacterized protein n=1 Tax=Capsaspora owczarzaki (strain ATCC 30864) TaxID=595528 RepID=A0A0D2WLM7_CAPO3|nr:hypothetical protein CAOG_02634 [Capsaspora owczarzaki ATCC 30864]KJE91505.1 hypothetical protein CAOG_002634 [Capsaspora owczarzaki ATCC 30864]|eukprot:XP_004349384.1 hypothetical protein CAOG_02634 [Capsaspora owczarzaki ATCC 30864]
MRPVFQVLGAVPPSDPIVTAEETRLLRLNDTVYNVKFLLVGHSMTRDGRLIEEDVRLQQEIQSVIMNLVSQNGRGGSVRTDSFVVMPVRKEWPASKSVNVKSRDGKLLRAHPWSYSLFFELIDPAPL